MGAPVDQRKLTWVLSDEAVRLARAGEPGHTFGSPIEHAREPRGIDRTRRKHYDQSADRRCGDHRARRVGRGIAKWTSRIAKADSSGHAHVILPNAGIGLALAPESHLDRVSLDVGEIVEAVGQLELQRAPIADVDHRVDAWQRITLADTSQQRFRRWPGLCRIEPDPFVHRPYRR